MPVLSQSVSIGGVTISGRVTRNAEGQVGLAVGPTDPAPLAAAKTGALTTRTNDTEGELTMTTGHGITTAAVIDLYWSGGRRYGVVVGTVATNAVPISGGAGDVLPADETAITAQVVTELDVDFDGDLLVALAMSATRRGTITLLDAADAVIVSYELLAGEPRVWAEDSSLGANPLAGEVVAYALISNGDSAGTNTIRCGVLYDAG